MDDILHINQEPILHKFDQNETGNKWKTPIALVLIILAGIISGYVLSRSMGNKTSVSVSTKTTGGSEKNKTVGVNDSKTFPDSAEGNMEAGGIDGEGTHKLIRPGGPSQTVYLTSSVLDLNEFISKKVRVWGETRAAQKAGWLMDVGKVETLE